jgi:hypothetical protein
MKIERVSYDVNWANFKRGYSIFVPCLDCVQARKDVYAVLKRLKKNSLAYIVVEEGVRGLRIWRL